MVPTGYIGTGENCQVKSRTSLTTAIILEISNQGGETGAGSEENNKLRQSDRNLRGTFGESQTLNSENLTYRRCSLENYLLANLTSENRKFKPHY